MPAHPEFLNAFRDGIGSGALPPGVTATHPDEAAQRFAVYRNNVMVGLTGALGLHFPAIEMLVGTDFFRALAREFAQTHRPRSPVLLSWGEQFPDFLAAFPPLADYPFMADVARIEVARGRAHHAADAAPIAAADLIAAVQDPASLILTLHPAVQVLRLSHSAVTIWAANQPGAAPLTTAPEGAEIALIWRDPVFNVPVAAIGPGDAALIEAIQSGQNLMIAAEMAAFAEPDHDPQTMLVRLMQAGAIVTPGKATL